MARAGRIVAGTLALMRTLVRPGDEYRGPGCGGGGVHPGPRRGHAVLQGPVRFSQDPLHLDRPRDRPRHPVEPPGAGGGKHRERGRGGATSRASTLIPPPPFRWAGSTPEAERLLSVTQQCLEAGIAQARVGNHVGDIGHAVQQVAEGAGYGVVRELVGHGIGTRFHEEPQVPNYGAPKRGPAPAGRDDARHRADDHGGQSSDQDARRQVDRGDRRRHACPRTSSTPWPSPQRPAHPHRRLERLDLRQQRAPPSAISPASRSSSSAHLPDPPAPTLRHSARPRAPDGAPWPRRRAALASPSGRARTPGGPPPRIAAAPRAGPGALAVSGTLGPARARRAPPGVPSRQGRERARTRRTPRRRTRASATALAAQLGGPMDRVAGLELASAPASRRSGEPRDHLHQRSREREAERSGGAAARAPPSGAASASSHASAGGPERHRAHLSLHLRGPWRGRPQPSSQRESRGFRRRRRYAPPRRPGRRNR